MCMETELCVSKLGFINLTETSGGPHQFWEYNTMVAYYYA